MKYEEINVAIDQAWHEFYQSLTKYGVINGDDIEKLDDLLNRKDCFNDVEDCVMECVR